MTFFGLGLIIIGFVGFLAGLAGMAIARDDSQIVRRFGTITLGHAAWLASAAAPLMVAGFIMSDPRRVVVLLAEVHGPVWAAQATGEWHRPLLRGHRCQRSARD